jgi:hypothetical protein
MLKNKILENEFIKSGIVREMKNSISFLREKKLYESVDL